MEEIEEKNEHFQDECVSSIDADFCSFYYKGVKRLLDIDCKTNVSHLYRYAKIFNKYYDIFGQVKTDLDDDDDDVFDEVMELLESSLYYRIMYFYRNATQFSSAVAFHFQNAYKQNPIAIKRLIKKRIVKICSIGGCSVPGIVAIITVLKSIAQEIGFEIDFRVTVIDVSEDWKTSCIIVLGCLEEFHEATWKINFIQCNLEKTKTWTSEMLQTIQEADVVTMVRFHSSIIVKRNIVEVISDKLQTGGILFILDRPYAKFIELYFGITNLGDFRLLHSELCDYHTIDIEAVKQFRTLYNKHFGDEKLFLCNVSGNLFVSVWQKVASKTHAKYKDNVECIFENNAEKSSSKPVFLCNNTFNKWENLFRQKKKKAGWSEKSINKFVKQQKEKNSDLFGKYIQQKKEVDSLQNHLLSQLQWLEKDRKQFNETSKVSLVQYLSQKSQLSLLKKTAYFSFLSALNVSSFPE